MNLRRDISVILGISRRGVKILFTNPAILVPSVIFPLFFLAAFAGGLAPIRNVPNFDFPAGYTSFIYVFVLLQAVAFAGVFTGFAAARDMESGFTRRMMLAAPSRLTIIAGYSLTAFVRGAFSGLVVTVAAYIGGLKIIGNGADVLGLVTLAVIVNQSALLWAAGIAMRFRTIQAGPLMQIPVFLVLFLSPVYVPLNLLTDWLRSTAELNPFTYIVGTGRDFVAGLSADLFLTYGLGLGLVIALTVWAIRSLRSAESNP